MAQLEGEPAYSIYRGSALGGRPAYRVVSKCPPSPDDFISYLLAGRNFPDELFFRATGVSMFVKRSEAVKLARGATMGTCIAEVDLNDDRIFLTLTNRRTGHIDVWARPRALVNRVVNCADTREG